METILDEIEIEKEIKYAGFWLRILALIVDIVAIVALMIILAIPLIILGILSIPFGSLFDSFEGINQLILLSSLGDIGKIISLLISVGVGVAFDISKWHGTPGKYICGLQITEIKNGNPITLQTSVKRNLIKNSASIVAIIPFLNSLNGLVSLTLIMGFIACAFTAKKQGLHDILAGTTVSYR